MPRLKRHENLFSSIRIKLKTFIIKGRKAQSTIKQGNASTHTTPLRLGGWDALLAAHAPGAISCSDNQPANACARALAQVFALACCALLVNIISRGKGAVIEPIAHAAIFNRARAEE